MARRAAHPPADPMPPTALSRHYDRLVAQVSVHQDLLPQIAISPGPSWLWSDFCTSFAAQEAAPER